MYYLSMRRIVALCVLSLLAHVAHGCTNGEATEACSRKSGGGETKDDNPCAVCCKEHGSEQIPDHKAGKCECGWRPIK